MKQSKAFIFCLSFCWASFLVDLYAAWQTNYWAMALGTAGVRILMTTIALAWRASNRLRAEPSLPPACRPASFGSMPQEPLLFSHMSAAAPSLSAHASAPDQPEIESAHSRDARSLDAQDDSVSESYQPAVG